jgi:hypothetical protein
LLTSQDFIKTSTVRCSPWASRRIVAFCFVFAWSVFWLVSSLLLCCKLPVVQDHSITASADVKTTTHDSHGTPEHHPANNSNACTELVIAVSTEVAAVQSPLAVEHAIYAHYPDTVQEFQVELGLNYAISLPLAPPRSTPFHLRTSRILI